MTQAQPTGTPMPVQITLQFSSIAAMAEFLAPLNGREGKQDTAAIVASTAAAAVPGHATPLATTASTPAPAAPPAEPMPALPPGKPADTTQPVVLATPAATTPRRKRGEAKATVAPVAEPTTPAPASTNLFDTPPATPAPTIAPVAEAATPGTPTVVSTGPITVDQCRAALGKVNDKHGMTVAYGMLQEVGAERVSLIAEDKRAAFIASCEAKAAA